MFAQFLVIAFACYFSIADCGLISGLEGKWRLSRAERGGRLVSRPMWKAYTLEIVAGTGSNVKQPVAKSYRRAKSAVFIRNTWYNTDGEMPLNEDQTAILPAPPIDPVQPNQQTPPAQPTQPTTSAQPVQPTQPTTPAQPIQPTQPTTPEQPVQPSPPPQPLQPIKPVQPNTPKQPAQSNYYTFNFYVKNKITATLRLREDGRWVILEGEHTLSFAYGEDYRAEVFIEKVLEAFKYLSLKGRSLYLYGYGKRMIKFSKIQ